MLGQLLTIQAIHNFETTSFLITPESNGSLLALHYGTIISLNFNRISLSLSLF